MAHLVSSSTALAFLTNKSGKHKSTSPSLIQVKNQRKTICIEEKLDVISQLEKGECVVDIWCNVIFSHSSICMIHDNVGRITESAKSGPKVRVASL